MKPVRFKTKPFHNDKGEIVGYIGQVVGLFGRVRHETIPWEHQKTAKQYAKWYWKNIWNRGQHKIPLRDWVRSFVYVSAKFIRDVWRFTRWAVGHIIHPGIGGM